MARINLLPWRREERARKNKEFQLLALLTAGITALAIVLGYSLVSRELKQNEANQLITEKNNQLDVALKDIETLEAQRDEMLSQMQVIQNLQGQRSIPVRVWDDIARAIPTPMYLTSIKREDDVITITGHADNANVVASLVRNLNASQWLDGTAVVSITSKIEAYQPSVVSQMANNPNAPERPIYPEDTYVQFVVTTKVQKPQEQPEGPVDPMADTIVIPPATPAPGQAPVVDSSLTNPIGVENSSNPAPAPAQAAPAPTTPAPTAPPAPAPAPTGDVAPAPEAGMDEASMSAPAGVQ